MKIFRFKIGTKLILGFLVVVFIFGGVAYYQIQTFQELAQLQDGVAKRAEDALNIKNVVFRVGEVYTVIADGVINRDLEETRKDFEQAKIVAQQDIATVRELVDTAEEEAWAETFVEKYTSYLDHFEEEMLPILERGESAEKRFADALAINNIARRVNEVYTVIADGVINRNLEETIEDFEQLKTAAQLDIATVRELVDTAEEEAWAVTFAEQYISYLDHFGKEMLPILERGESTEKRFADALAINNIANRVNEVYAVMADGVINRNLEETTQDFEQIKTAAQQDIAAVRELVDTAEEEAWAVTFAEQYNAYLDLFETRMLPLLRGVEYSAWDEIRRLDDQIDQLRDATLTPLIEITRSLEQESVVANQDMITIRELDKEIDNLRVATLAPLNDIIKSLERESFVANQDTIKIRELDGEIDTIRGETMVPLNNINTSLVQENAEADQVFDATREQVIRLSIMISVAGGIVAFVIAVFITFSITRPLKQAVAVNNKLSEGDLNLEITVKRRDEIGQLLTAMQHMTEKLREVVTVVKAGAMNLASGSEEMAQGSAEQASSVEEASTSMEQMAANIKQNADNALQTEKIAVQAAESAREGENAVAETVAAMKEIAEKITIIEEIARQTHMLSLNATIEAAKAQEYGKGFAVVASEVRALAERSRMAATEINQLSTSSVTIAEKAGERLRQLVPDIQKTAELVQEISSASNEQSSGANQINRAIQQLDQVVQQNASVSEELASQAEELQATVGFFKIQETDRETMAKVEHALGKARTTPTTGIKAKVAHLNAHQEVEGERRSGDGKPGGFVFHVKQNEVEGDERDEEFERY